MSCSRSSPGNPYVRARSRTRSRNVHICGGARVNSSPELPKRLVPVSQQLREGPFSAQLRYGEFKVCAADGKVTRGLFPDARLEVAVVCAHWSANGTRLRVSEEVPFISLSLISVFFCFSPFQPVIMPSLLHMLPPPPPPPL